MKEELAIVVKNLSKVFNLRSNKLKNSNKLLALNNVSFSIKRGEQVGIFGLNGSGKSTLLKILSGITKPTEGSVEVWGKVASILDIGAGFHPELSGNENIFLNGQLLGFSRECIQNKYEEIVDFSGIEKFINEPVKNYSNGMYLRLAFSILSHLEFDVYLFDEVMHVGDSGFMYKAQQKIQALSEMNKTIIIVSHNLNDMHNCDTLIELNEGNIKNISSQKDVLSKYVTLSIKENNIDILTRPATITQFKNGKPGAKVNLQSLKVYQELNCNETFISSRPFFIELQYEKLTNKDTIDTILTISDSAGIVVLVSAPFITGIISENTSAGTYNTVCEIPNNFFNSNIYCIGITFVKNTTSLQHINLQNAENLTSVFEKYGVAASYAKICYFSLEIVMERLHDLRRIRLPVGYLLPGFKWSTNKN